MPHDITPRRLAAEAKASAGNGAKVDAPVYPVVINPTPKVHPPVGEAGAEGKTRLAFTPDDRARLDAILHEAVDSRQVNALTLAVSDAEGELYFKCAGERVFGEPEKGEVDDRTMFQLFSCTKLVTSVACLQLCDRGVLSLDNPAVIDHYLPEVACQPVLRGYASDAPGSEILEPRTVPMTLRHLLSHSSGLAYGLFSPVLERWMNERDRYSRHFFDDDDGGVSGHIGVPLVSNPGERFVYGIGIDWAGIMVERASGLTLEEYFQQNIFTPLGLHDLVWFTNDDVRSRLQQACGRVGGELVHSNGIRALVEREKGIKQLAGGGGLIGTAKDYLTFLRAILRSAQPGGLLTPESYAELFANSLPPRDQTTGYADLASVVYTQPYSDDNMCANGGQGLAHSVGLTINTVDSVHGRKAGSGTWGGACKTDYWIDPATGIIGMCFAQIFAPAPEPPATEPFNVAHEKFERAVYDAIEAK
ncbi:hypothetical protein Q8F55_003418 [Vanrija albida]|uniref:Beta-lactamase-related domain-containing protein n=1 Tax=Vanrija albida TaxID=181172 RepID=A0ABR3Q3W9_9TREE